MYPISTITLIKTITDIGLLVIPPQPRSLSVQSLSEALGSKNWNIHILEEHNEVKFTQCDILRIESIKFRLALLILRDETVAFLD